MIFWLEHGDWSGEGERIPVGDTGRVFCPPLPPLTVQEKPLNSDPATGGRQKGKGQVDVLKIK